MFSSLNRLHCRVAPTDNLDYRPPLRSLEFKSPHCHSFGRTDRWVATTLHDVAGDKHVSRLTGTSSLTPRVPVRYCRPESFSGIQGPQRTSIIQQRQSVGPSLACTPNLGLWRSGLSDGPTMAPIIDLVIAFNRRDAIPPRIGDLHGVGTSH